MPGFEPATRAQNLSRLAAETFDLVVLGGGITGAGVARDAALRGLTVALLEARDFAAGTSSRSSKLIHGGVRYLQQGEVGLVREAATERAVLRRIAPHLATKTEMLLPVWGRTSAGVYKLKVGLALFDKLAAVSRAERHRTLSRDEALDAEPRLVSERLQGAVVYPEFVTDDARLVLDTLKAAHHAGAVVVNYTRATGLGADGSGRVVEIEDVESGAASRVRARVVVNAGGPWVDTIRRLDGDGSAVSLHLTKGIHLVLEAGALPLRHSVVMRARDGRPVFAVPLGDVIYVGTTDTTYHGPLEEPAVTAEDADYLFDALARTFAGPTLGPADVVGTWAGLRPLVREEGKDPSEISRKDEVTVTPTGTVTIAGGKLTTYRRMAERVLEAAAPQLGRPLPDVDTTTQPLAGGDLGDAASLDAWASSSATRATMRAVPEAVAARLVATYGTDAAAVVAAADDPESLAPLAPGTALSLAEVRYAVRAEMARTLADVLERRSRVALFATAKARALAPRVAAVLARELDWSDTRTAAEIRAFEGRADDRLAWRDAETGRAAS